MLFLSAFCDIWIVESQIRKELTKSGRDPRALWYSITSRSSANLTDLEFWRGERGIVRANHQSRYPLSQSFATLSTKHNLTSHTPFKPRLHFQGLILPFFHFQFSFFFKFSFNFFFIQICTFLISIKNLFVSVLVIFPYNFFFVVQFVFCLIKVSDLDLKKITKRRQLNKVFDSKFEC